MRKLFALKIGRLVFYACAWDCGMYSIERITKSFGGTVATFETLEELKKYANENNYKIAKEKGYKGLSGFIVSCIEKELN